jgi:hypothetical protein
LIARLRFSGAEVEELSRKVSLVLALTLLSISGKYGIWCEQVITTSSGIMD